MPISFTKYITTALWLTMQFGTAFILLFCTRHRDLSLKLGNTSSLVSYWIAVVFQLPSQYLSSLALNLVMRWNFCKYKLKEIKCTNILRVSHCICIPMGYANLSNYLVCILPIIGAILDLVIRKELRAEKAGERERERESVCVFCLLHSVIYVQLVRVWTAFSLDTVF